MRVATWNTKWVASVHRAAITDTLLSTNADVIVGTEILDDLLPSYEHVVDAGTDWGYEVDDARRRKVAMWSRNPWSDVTTLDDTAPGGRLVAATTDAGDGPVRVIGVCIPWDRAHVHTGSKDRQRWDDHEAFLAALGALINLQSLPTIVTGDFNQRIPRHGQPLPVFDALCAALGDLEVPTAGETDHGPLIDHVAHSADLTATIADVICPQRGDAKLSDHHGVVVDLTRRFR
ncbi:MAG: endonuclease/exonuclease/phosphatase family protein [Microthrixaceae bacterium]|nr:endonuclease/exonuclease/phosphatase family protein [Acidimicrobiales bacterium]MCB9404363.1 endonuclease/exonuclease/phosphatase family protein [Microthrixaceae bacterium]